jgi:hypothetical protein
MRRLPSVFRFLATWRLLALATVLAVGLAVAGASSGIASASSAPHRPLRHGAHGMPGSGLTLAQSPAGLRAAVRRTLGTPAASAGGSLQQAELFASDAAANDRFGYSVAFSGSTAVVGAYVKNSSTGAAYVFTRSGGTWFLQAELTASDGATDDRFGWSVAVSGSTVVVGAYGKNSNTGAAYVFTGVGGTWSQQAELTASNGGADDRFGWSVAISGSTVVVGAYLANSAYVFTGVGGTWSQQAELTASDASGFGNSVALAGSTVVVAASASNEFTGAAYVFTRSGGTWSQQAELTTSDAATGDGFGISVALSGSTAVVGAPDGNQGTGAAYVFTRSGGTWSQQAKLTAADGARQDEFGNSVAIVKSTAVVGAPGNHGIGAAYAFVLPSQQAELIASDAAANDRFGYSVAFSGSTAVVGAYVKNSSTGAAYVFTRSGGTWFLQAELTASDGAANDRFGWSVAVSGSTVVVGAYGKNSNTGAAYVFTGVGGTWSQQAELTASNGAANDHFGWSVAVSGSTVVVGAYGANSAYVYLRSGGTWSRQAELTASNASGFGHSVALAGSTVVVGAPDSNEFAGAAYVYLRSRGTWFPQAELTASNGAPDTFFGISVALSGSTVLVGAYGQTFSGAAYVFTDSGSIWSQQAELTASDGAANDSFGWSVALAGSTAVVGAPGNQGTGAAYVFTRSGSTWSQQAKLTAADGARQDEFGNSVAIVKSTAVVGAPGNHGIGAAYAFIKI